MRGVLLLLSTILYDLWMNDILYISIGSIVSEILLENRKLLTLKIHGTRAPVYTKKIHPAPYIPIYGSNTLRGG